MNFQKNAFLFLLFSAILIGNAYTILDYFPYEHGVDADGYLEMAKGNFDVSLIRRYRFVVPLLAGGIYKLGALITPEKFHFKILLCSFFLVNTTFMSLASLFVFKLCQRHQAGFTASFIAILAMLTSRWTGYFTGQPFTDSFFLFMIAVFLFYLKEKNNLLQLLILVFGTVSKESFLLFFPLYFMFNEENKIKKVSTLLFALAIYFSYRFLLDYFMVTPSSEGIHAAVEHWTEIKDSLKLIFSPFGIAILVAVHGFFNLIFLYGIKDRFESLKISIFTLEKPLLFMPPIIVSHMLLSGSVERMYYFISPLFCVLLAVFIEKSGILKILEEK